MNGSFPPQHAPRDVRTSETIIHRAHALKKRLNFNIVRCIIHVHGVKPFQNGRPSVRMPRAQFRTEFGRRDVRFYAVNFFFRVILPRQCTALGHINQRIHHGNEVVSTTQRLPPMRSHAGVPRAPNQRTRRFITVDALGHSKINEIQQRHTRFGF